MMKCGLAIRLWLTIGILATTLGLGMVSQAQAFNPQPEPPACMPLGIVESQIAVLHVLVPPDSLNRAPIAVKLALYNSEGKELRSRKDKVEPGQVVSMRFPGRALGLGLGDRVAIYGVVQCLGRVAEKMGCAQVIIPSLELFDAKTGKTDVVVPVVPGIVKVSDIEPF